MDSVTLDKLNDLDNLAESQLNEKLQTIAMFIAQVNSERLNQFEGVLVSYHGTHRRALDGLVAKHRSQLATASTKK